MHIVLHTIIIIIVLCGTVHKLSIYIHNVDIYIYVYIKIYLYCVCVCVRPREIPFTLPPRFTTQDHGDLKNEEEEKDEEMKMEAQRDVLAHRGSLSVRSRSSLPLFDSLSSYLKSLGT